MKTLLLCLLLFSTPVISSDFSLLIGQWSHHTRDSEDNFKYNEVHELIGFEYKDIGLATFINSEFDRTYMIGYTPTYFKSSYLDFGLIYALVHGYDREIKVFPIILPRTTLHYKDFPVKVDFNWVPTIVLTTGFRIDF